jgi:EmrB/QacA subfamily drug resistance transporter
MVDNHTETLGHVPKGFMKTPTTGAEPMRESALQRHRRGVLIFTSVGVFAAALDTSKVAIALPVLGPRLHLGYVGALWVVAGLSLTLSMFLIPLGRFADARGHVVCFHAGVVIFGICSVAAALAPNGLALIAIRATQGVGNAFIFAIGAAVITAVFPARERGRALGLNVMCTYVGLTLGPPVGGLILAHLGWRWLFLSNVPLAIIALAAGWSLIGAERSDRRAAARRRERPGPAGGVDVAGTVLLGAFLLALFVPLTFSPLWGWQDARTLVPLAGSIALLVAFVVVEDRVRAPVLDLALLRGNRPFVAANIASFLNYAACYGVTICAALLLEIVQGRSAQSSGLILLVQPLFMAILTPFTGRLSDRVGTRVLSVTGMVLIAAGMLVMSTVSAQTPVWRIVSALAVLGAGTASFSVPNMSAVMGAAPRSQLSLASGFMATMRFCGQGFSVALLGAIAASRLGRQGARVILLGPAAGLASSASLAAGFREALLAGAALALIGALVSMAAAPGLSVDDPLAAGQPR